MRGRNGGGTALPLYLVGFSAVCGGITSTVRVLARGRVEKFFGFFSNPIAINAGIWYNIGVFAGAVVCESRLIHAPLAGTSFGGSYEWLHL